ncbi:MAG: hypothetical protein V4808_04675 [Pseudomonadota bacterium]
MKLFRLVMLALVMTISGTSIASAQLSPGVAEMEKERLRKAKEPIVSFTAADVEAARAARRANPALDFASDCAAKLAKDCFDWGNHLRSKNGRTAEDGKYELTAFTKACELKHPEGCYKLGEMHEKGSNTPIDRKMAFNVYGLSCKLGFSSGCYSAATILSAARGSTPAEQDKQAQGVQALYKAGCDLKHVYACKAIGLAPVEAPVVTAQAPQPAAATAASALPVLHPTPGSGHVAADEENIRLKGDPRIDAAMKAHMREMTAQGFTLVGRSHVLRRYDDQQGNLYKLNLNDLHDYVLFAACSAPCASVSLMAWPPQGGGVFFQATNKGVPAKTRWLELSPKASGPHSVQVQSNCPSVRCDTDSGAGAQLAVYRRVKTMDIEAVPAKP